MLSLSSISLCTPTTGQWMRSVPLARRDLPTYYGTFARTGSFGPTMPSSAERWPAGADVGSVLELSAGRGARWSREVASAARGSQRYIVAADMDAPDACPGVACVAIDNAALGRFASLPESAGRFDLIFGGHALCTCRWPLSPGRFVRARAAATSSATEAAADAATTGTEAAAAAAAAAAAGDDAAVTCGGLRLESQAVDEFVLAISTLLTPRGVAVFDQEGGWPFGLEEMLRRAASRAGLHFYSRRGPMGTNFSYLLSACPLADDVSDDPLQRDARAVDAAILLFAPAVYALAYTTSHGMVPAEAMPAADFCLHTVRPAAAYYLIARLLLPFAGVCTIDDLIRRLQGRFVD